MAQGVSRRALLRGRFQSEPEPAPVPRPPGAVDAGLLESVCDGVRDCGRCVNRCPTQVLGEDGNGLPFIDFARGECTLCGDCTTACPTGAIGRDGFFPSWDMPAVAEDKCLALNGVTCRVCEEQCAPRAIRFRLATRGRSRPVVDAAACTRCGACAAPCPEGAITLAPLADPAAHRPEETTA